MRRFPLVMLSLLLLAAAVRAEDAILVFDASGSMWAQIQGKTRIEIARTVVGEILTKVPAERRLGLVAYGHRREGDCADIEELAPVGTDRAAIAAKVNALKPKGKTPLTDGVRFAAAKLRSTEQKATVILVSDGAESCNRDPCALARELEASGVDLTIHVVGFALASQTESAGLRCMAEATGGRYFGAADASELSVALQSTLAAPEPPAPVANANAHVLLRATELDGGPEVTSGLNWRVAAAGAEPVYSIDNAGATEADIAPGKYEALVKRASDGATGKADFEASAGAERTVTIPLPLAVEAELVLDPAGTAPAGSTVRVQWKGPDREGDFITVVAKGAEPTAYLDYKYTKDGGNPAPIALPALPGEYEMRYVLGRPPRVLAAVPITASPASATITAAAEVGAGARFAIDWTGPNLHGDWLTIVKPDAGVHDYASYVDADQPHPGALTAPLEPGDYELRYVAGGVNVLVRVPIKVGAVSASIEAAASVPAGAPFEIRWTGPNNSSDWLTIIAPSANAQAYGSYVDAPNGSPAKLNAPLEPGDYELRYVAQGREILARAPITVTAVMASIQAPEQVAAGAAFEIGWQGPNGSGDWLTIIAPSAGAQAYGSYVDAVGASTSGRLTAPKEPGDYELRYVQGGKKVLARKAIRVSAP